MNPDSWGYSRQVLQSAIIVNCLRKYSKNLLRFSLQISEVRLSFISLDQDLVQVLRSLLLRECALQTHAIEPLDTDCGLVTMSQRLAIRKYLKSLKYSDYFTWSAQSTSVWRCPNISSSSCWMRTESGLVGKELWDSLSTLPTLEWTLMQFLMQEIIKLNNKVPLVKSMRIILKIENSFIDQKSSIVVTLHGDEDQRWLLLECCLSSMKDNSD